MNGDWISTVERMPELLGYSVLIAKPLRSRPNKFTVSIGYAQRRHAGSDDYVWVDMLHPNDLLTTVKYWQPLPDTSQLED